MKRLGAAILAALLVTHIANAAEPTPTRPVTVTWSTLENEAEPSLFVGTTFRDALPSTVIDKLSNGLTTTIAMRAYLFEDPARDPIALAARTCRIAFDLWDEVFRVRVSSHSQEREVVVINAEGVLRQCAEVRDFRIGLRSLMKADKKYMMVFVIDVNPMSPQMIEQMRRWISRPTGSTSIAPSDALFSSFVGIFLRKLGTSDHTVRFRSPSFLRP